MDQGYKKKITIIEKDKDLSQLFKAFLENYEYRVDVFTEPIDALISFKQEKYDLILLGLNSPELDGIAIYKKLKEIKEGTSILILTPNYNFAKYIENKFPELQDNIIYEPVSLKELKIKVDKIMSREYDIC